MKNVIADLAHHEGDINWSQASDVLALAILRVQYGSNLLDRKYYEYVTGCKAYGIPHGAYAYGCFESVADAIVEANDFMNRVDKSARFLVLDVEKDTLKSCGASNLAEASQAFIDTCRAAGWKVGFYVSHEMYMEYGLNNVQADFLWIPRYGTNDGTPQKKPAYACDIWQYTDNGRLSGCDTDVDLNLLNGDKPLEYFTGEVVSIIDNGKYIKTGGLGFESVCKISQYFLDRGYWARVEFTGQGDAFAQTGGLYEPELGQFKEWLDGQGWWFEVL
ncbi:N-acetylmuramoyl-L-alanine amidase [Bacillus pseudomycoides]|uniref:N-acetylmuramoyl-L-alanine amidase n=1 Tax=Bacillus pseudomycoides TaxID=64104 RepID=A0AA91VCA1_9BACI|nr:GH25 family lysozyme [Bacillus pseudomycoides]PED82326.1 N-acetylmuramoyl-L-alanine amidase [Bacillus pseudomycoides]